MGRPATNKRARLVEAAVQLFHQKGYARTSIADVAKTAGMPSGNVFYFFKAKEDLARAVVDDWCRMLAEYLSGYNSHQDYRKRIEKFIENARVISEMYVALGCPLAGLARDLRQEGNALPAEAKRVYALQFEWLTSQFTLGGFSVPQATAHTRFLMAGYHGAILLAHAQGDPSLIAGEVTSLKAWLQSLSRPASRSTRKKT